MNLRSYRILKLKTQKALPFANQENPPKSQILSPYAPNGEHWEAPRDEVMVLFSKLFHDQKTAFTHIIKEAERFLTVSIPRKAGHKSSTGKRPFEPSSPH